MMKRWSAVDESMIYPAGEFAGTPYSLWQSENQVVMVLEVDAPEEPEVRATVLEVARQEISEIFVGRFYGELETSIVFLDEVLALHSLSHAGERKRK